MFTLRREDPHDVATEKRSRFRGHGASPEEGAAETVGLTTDHFATVKTYGE